MTETIPLIDVSGLRSPHEADRAAVAAALGAACRDVGFFYVAGHGLPPSLREKTFDAARTFFAQPFAAKDALTIRGNPHNRGYVGVSGEKLDQTAAPDMKEAFNVGLDLAPDDPEVLAGAPFRGVNLWPALPGWREDVLAWFDACRALGGLLHRGLSRDLGLREDFFDDKLDRPAATLRLLRYPAPRRDEPAAPGAGEHTDYGNLTLLATDGVAGLQVRRRDGRWIDAPHVEDAFVCNIGDCLMRWSNDVYVSTPHRVTRPTRERFSIAFFLDANPDALVEAIPSCVPPGERPRHPPITAGGHLRAKLDASYAHLKS